LSFIKAFLAFFDGVCNFLAAFLLETHEFIWNPDAGVFCLGMNFNEAFSGVVTKMKRSLFVLKESYLAVRNSLERGLKNE
jgi:hypothetical protein